MLNEGLQTMDVTHSTAQSYYCTCTKHPLYIQSLWFVYSTSIHDKTTIVEAILFDCTQIYNVAQM